MRAFQTFMIDMRVNLGGGDVGMAKHHLHGSQIGAMGKKVRCEGVTQHVRGNVLADTCCDRKFLEDLPETQPRHAAAAIGDEGIVAYFAVQYMRTSVVEVMLNPFFSRISSHAGSSASCEMLY